MAGDRLTDLPCFFVWAALRRPEPRGITLACDKVEQDGVSLPEHAWCPVCRARAAASPPPESAAAGWSGERVLTAFFWAMKRKASEAGLGATFQGGPLHGASVYNVYEKCAREASAFMAECPAGLLLAPASPPSPSEREARAVEVLTKAAGMLDHVASYLDRTEAQAACSEMADALRALASPASPSTEEARAPEPPGERERELLATALLQISDYADASAKGDPSDAV